LSREGVEKLVFAETPESPPETVIRKEDLPAFDVAAADDEVLLEDEREMLVEIASVSFEGHKWRLSDGQQTFHATIEDPGFLHRVEIGREKFAQGDLLRLRMRVVQTRRPDGRLHSDYHVLQVLQHIPSPTQTSLDDLSSGQ
jgi:hypothetical protein